jgi:hypothetical protein
MRRSFALLACLTLALAPGAAEAKKKKKKPPLGPVLTAAAPGNTVSAVGQVSTAAANCPAGTQAIGGGFSAPFNASVGIAVIDSYRSGQQTWTVSGISQIAGPGAATAFAYCRSTKQLADVTGTGVVPSGLLMTGSASATCPSDTQLVGGGFQSTRGPTPGAYAFPATNIGTGPSTWSVTAINNTSGAQTITAHAYCIRGIRAAAFLSTTASPTTAFLGSASATSPACPKPKKPKKGKKKNKKKKKPRRLLTAGGFSSPFSPQTGLVPRYTDSHIGVGGWLATAVNITGPNAPFSVTSEGVCV